MGSWPSGPYDNLLFDPPPLHKFVIWKHSTCIGFGASVAACFLAKSLQPCAKFQQCNIVLTHGDLNERNIVVDDGTITGLVDWETLGWYPDFWELMAALQGCYTPEWREELSVALGPPSDLSLPYHSVLSNALHRPWAE
ncbi:hypothetical protein B0H34DRAFT_663221 [Crassisporium funariophilum]|nr:hypothetical protein B0H34DRAFT_663221 [Crassisporium funariophilum]